jgi:hypothetical protein
MCRHLGHLHGRTANTFLLSPPSTIHHGIMPFFFAPIALKSHHFTKTQAPRGLLRIPKVGGELLQYLVVHENTLLHQGASLAGAPYFSPVQLYGRLCPSQRPRPARVSLSDGRQRGSSIQVVRLACGVSVGDLLLPSNVTAAGQAPGADGDHSVTRTGPADSEHQSLTDSEHQMPPVSEYTAQPGRGFEPSRLRAPPSSLSARPASAQAPPDTAAAAPTAGRA